MAGPARGVSKQCLDVTTCARPYGDKEELSARFQTLGFFIASVLIGVPMLFGLLITGVFWATFSLVCQLIGVSWKLRIFFLIVKKLVKKGQLLIMTGLRWWTVSAIFVQAFIIMVFFD